MTAWVALLRGVNVGGKGIIAMSALKESFEALRLRDVSTYINSGNVLFRASEDPARLEKKIEKKLLAEHGLATRAIVRSRDELDAIVSGFPRGFATKAGWKHNVIFLSRDVDDAAVLDDLPPKPGIERVAYVPGALLWSAAEKTLARSTMLKLGRSPLYPQVTVRNPNTARKLRELLGAMPR